MAIQPAQQQLLIGLGFPPCATGSTTTAAWVAFQAASAGKPFPLFDISRYLDIQARAQNPTVALPSKPLEDMFSTGDVDTGLEQLQEQYAQAVTQTKATRLPAGY